MQSKSVSVFVLFIDGCTAGTDRIPFIPRLASSPVGDLATEVRARWPSPSPLLECGRLLFHGIVKGMPAAKCQTCLMLWEFAPFRLPLLDSTTLFFFSFFAENPLLSASGIYIVYHMLPPIPTLCHPNSAIFPYFNLPSNNFTIHTEKKLSLFASITGTFHPIWCEWIFIWFHFIEYLLATMGFIRTLSHVNRGWFKNRNGHTYMQCVLWCKSKYLWTWAHPVFDPYITFWCD